MSAQVCAFGKVLAQQAVGVLIHPSLPRAMRIAEEDRQAGVYAQLSMLSHLSTLVPGQRSAQLLRQIRDRGGDRVSNGLGAVACVTDTDRPQLDRLMADVRQGKVDLVVVWRLASFVRSMPQLWNIIDEFQQREVDLVVLKQPNDTTEGKQTFAILTAVAEFESELMREKIRLGMAEAKARGRRVGRKPIPAKKQDMARRLRAQGDTYRTIAAALKISPRTAFTYAHDVDNYEV